MKEWLLVAAVGALAGYAAPRVLVPWQRPQPHAPRSAATAAPAPHASDDDEVGFDDPPPRSVALGAGTTTPDPVPPLDAPRVRRGGVRAMPHAGDSPSDGLLSRRGSQWLLDLHGVSQPRSLLSGLHMRPLAEDGAGDGYRVTRLDQRGLCARAGIRPGDDLVAVNGHPVRNADEALDAYIRCRGQRTFALRFRRGASTYTVPVALNGDVPLP